MSAEPYVPEHADLGELQKAAAGCEGCHLYEDATQTVFGEGGADARVVLVGEQPGDQEDKQGHPFVGPAGRVLDRALDEAGIERDDAYVTNAVKHFKFSRQGKRRIHQKPGITELRACLPWLRAELTTLNPEVIVALGATAGQALLGPEFRVTKQRGVPLPCPPLDRLGTREEQGEGRIVATIHPSAVLRAEDRDAAYDGLLADLRVAAALLA
ncbi:UdgX family uracil-DNA binding protein [Actinomadura rayongensis]|uniref:Type-4 uracil-DNA glycosylase n=1 Tax=Actinomadura rayongensis TaxID=1429076 RepID=A0A6I4WDV5_9ACTN|nr:UdgX family uracil-DNA binding protein [Actinomadura rayongensis]MXQ66026.1 UdgX family uracil-DNA binding protein [Actinomadura rayongensis]